MPINKSYANQPIANGSRGLTQGKQDGLILPELSYSLVGVLFLAHNNLGRFCNEKQYADAVEKLLKERDILNDREKIILPSFVGEHDGRNKADFIVDNKILLELKTKRVLTREDYYQVRRYLKAANLKLGILVNFREIYLKPRRILNSEIPY